MEDNTVYVKEYDEAEGLSCIDEREILRYAGYPPGAGTVDEALYGLLKEVIDELKGAFSYRVCYMRMPVVWEGKVPRFLRWLFTLLAAVVGWTIFYYTDTPALFAHLQALFGVGGLPWTDPASAAALRQYALFLPLVCLAAAPLVPRLKKLAEGRPALAVLGTVFAVAVGLLSLLFLIRQSYNPFIYFRF